MSFIYNMTDTWNNSGTVFTAVKMNVTNTASAAGSKLIDLQVAGTSQFNVDSSGNVGIGTSSPGTVLDITKTQAATSSIRIVNANTAYDCGYVSGDGSGSSAVGYAGSTNGGYQGIVASGAYWYSTGSGGISLTTWNASASIKFSTNSGSERMRIDSSGNVGIGTSSPSERLRVVGTSGSAQFGAGTSGNAVFVNAFDSNPIYMTASASNSTAFGFGAASNIPLFFMTNNTERMRIDSSDGTLFIGTTGAIGGSSAFLQVVDVDGGRNGIAVGNSTAANATVAMRFLNSNGTVGSIITSGVATAYNISSDERLKTNIEYATDAGDIIDSIKVRQFDWISDKSHQRFGVIAQELIEVAPEAVSPAVEETDFMGVDYSKLVPMLVKEVQSLRARVAQLEGK